MKYIFLDQQFESTGSDVVIDSSSITALYMDYILSDLFLKALRNFLENPGRYISRPIGCPVNYIQSYKSIA